MTVEVSGWDAGEYGPLLSVKLRVMEFLLWCSGISSILGALEWIKDLRLPQLHLGQDCGSVWIHGLGTPYASWWPKNKTKQNLVISFSPQFFCLDHLSINLSAFNFSINICFIFFFGVPLLREYRIILLLNFHLYHFVIPFLDFKANYLTKENFVWVLLP